MTREDIEQLNVVEPYCFESDREEQWYNVGLKDGSEIADNNPKCPWISVEERLPEAGEEVLLYNSHSVRHYEIGWLRKKKGDDKSKWAVSNGFVEDDDITHWMPIPKFPEE